MNAAFKMIPLDAVELSDFEAEAEKAFPDEKPVKTTKKGAKN